MACIIKTSPEYKALKNYFGEFLADSIIRNNGFEFPTVEQAAQMVKGNKVLQFKRALNYLRTTTSASIEDLLAAMPRIVQKKGEAIFVLKGSRLSDVPTLGTKAIVENANLAFLNKANEVFGEIFNIEGQEGFGESTGLSTITGSEPIFAGQTLPTRFQGGKVVGFVEESLAFARDSNQGMSSGYLTNAIYYAEGKVKGSPSSPNNVVLPYANKKLANQLTQLKDQFQNITGNSAADRKKKAKLKAKIFSTADKIYAEFKEVLKNNIRAIYDAWDPVLIARSKHWYDGANRIAQSFAKTYGLSLEAASGIIAALSPQNEWFNNISAANRVMDIMKYEADRPVDAEMFDQASKFSEGEDFNVVVEAARRHYVGRSLNSILAEIDESAQDASSRSLKDIAATLLRIIDLAVHNKNEVSVVLPEGVVSGIKKAGEENAAFSWGSSSEIYKAISIFKNPDIDNVSAKLGKGNKVRNFYNNIANPNSKNGEVTVDTHAAAAGLFNVIGSKDTASMGLFRNDSNGNSPLYVVLKEAYQEVAKEKGLLPREMQSVTWEAIRLLIHESDKTQANRDFINNIWEQVQNKKLKQNEAIRTIIGKFEFGQPEWVGSAESGTDRSGLPKAGTTVQQEERNADDLRRQRPGEPGSGATGVVTGDVVYHALMVSNPEELKKQFSPVFPNQFYHHSTIQFKPGTKEGIEVGKKQDIKITGRLTTDKVDVLIVTNPKSKKEVAHITLSTAEGVKPAQSDAEIKNNSDKIIPVTGKVSTVEGYFNGTSDVTTTEQSTDIVKQAIYSTPQVFNNLTEDGKGNYVFFHYSSSDLSKKGIDPSKFGKNVNKTGKEERGRSVPVSMYYTNDDTKETGVGDFKHVVRIPQSEVYPFNSDPLSLYDEAEKRFKEQFPDRAFSPNEQIGWIGKVAAERGFKMVVAKWTNGKQQTLRAESVQAFKPELVARPPKSGFYGEGTVESLTDEKFITNKKRYKGKIPVVQTEVTPQAEPIAAGEELIDQQEDKNPNVAPGTTKVSINESKLADLAEENKKNNTQVPFEDNVEGAKYQKKSHQRDYYYEDVARSQQRKRYSIDNIVRLLRKFNIPFSYINDASIPWAARLANGQIILNTGKIGLDTPFHEIAHPFVELLKRENPELYNNLINELKSTPEGQAEIDRIAKEYPELSPQDQLDEALVSMIGQNAADQYLNGSENSIKKSLLQRFWAWVKEKLFGMGIDATTFKPTSTIYDIAGMIVNPMFSIDLAKTLDLQERDEYYQKKSTQQMHRDFDALIDDTIAKLKADVNIHGRTETEKKRKFFSGKQAEDLIKDREDIQALNSFITSGLFNLKDINERFDEFIKKYESKTNRSKEDIRQLSLLLNEIEDNVTLYGRSEDLIQSVFDMFPDEADNFADWAYSLKREKRLKSEYQSWAVNVVADWLYPYQKKAVRKAMASNNRQAVVSDEVYNNEAKLAAQEGITDKNVILERAIKQEIRNTLLIAKRDASGITGYLAGVLNSRDSIASSVGQAVMDELHKALTYGHSVEKKFKALMKQYRGTSLFSSNAEEKEFYSKYLRQAKVWTYQGLGKDGKPEHKYVNRTAFHEEYEWDTFYNTKREDFDNILKQFGGKIPVKTDKVNYQKYKQLRDAWFSKNTVLGKDANGKDVRLPASHFKNAQFARFQNDSLFKEMYNTYKASNLKLGEQGLKYGIVPQLENSTVDIKGANARNALEAIRSWIGEQEQVYFVQSIAGGEKPVIPINHVRMLEEKDLSYNLINSVAKFAASSEKYNSMRMIEPQVQILKNFIGGNNALGIRNRRTIKRSASGIKALSRIIHDEMYVESKKLNKQLNSFLNDAVYGQSMKRDVIQIWDSKFEVWKTNDTSNNGGPAITTLHGFENVIQHTNIHDLDYSGFDYNKPRVVGDYTIKMTKKDWNFSVKKTGDRLGLLTALQTMVINPVSATVNIIRGKTETFVEALGGRYLNLKDYYFGEGEYFKALGSGDFFEDLRGGKPSFLSSMLIDYDGIQGEMIDAFGRKIDRSLANKFFRTRNLFLLQNGGEHYIQTQLMVAMMNHQKVKLNSGGSLSLYEARKREYNGQLKMTDTDWTADRNREFKETLAEVNTRLNGNYNKTDKAMIQRTWWGAALMMFRKHIYNGLANRYRKGYVNYQTGDWTEGYWRQFAHGVLREMGEMIKDRSIRKFNLSDQEKYAFRKFGGDLIALGTFMLLFLGFDDDDQENEFTDSLALIFRRLVSESGQYTPVIAPLELGKMVKNPSAITYTVNNFYEAFKQTLSDPTEEYERSGPGYLEGENKAWKKWQRAIPGWRIVLNTQEPERLLEFYNQNSLGFLKPKSGKDDDDE